MFLGLRISDLKGIRWCHVLDQESISLNKQKTGKRRILKINSQLSEIVKWIYNRLPLAERKVNKPICAVSIKFINRKLKEI
jgi:integrase